MSSHKDVSTGRARRLSFVAGLALVALGTLALGQSSVAWAQGNLGLGVPGVRGGVVTTSEPLAAKAGAEILRQGGNAIDAAVAVAFALNVIEPQSSGIGGGGFMMIHLAATNETFVVDSREEAPAAATPDMFVLASDPSNAFGFGIRSTSGIGVGVPGMVRGVSMALDNWGTKGLLEVMAPAIDIAENGFLVTSRLAGSLADGFDGGRLANEIGDPAYDAARALFSDALGAPLEEGDLFVQPDLAATLTMIAENGPDAFYTGPLADKIIETQLNARAVADPDDQAKLVGRMSLADLANYQAKIREPVEGNYRGLRVVSMPPPSSGGLTVIQILKLIEQFPLGDRDQGFGFGSTPTLHVMIEAMRLAFADRAIWMGDTDFVDLPVKGLIDDGYIATRAPLIKVESRLGNDDAVAGDPRPFDTAALPAFTKFAMIELPDEEGLNTTHFSIIDRDGNIVSYTNTIESAWGTGLLVQGFGFLLNNELTDFNRIPAFDPDPGSFNPGANDVAAGKRPRSSMSPTMIFRKDKPVAAFGSPGGSTIIDSVVNIALNLIDHEMTVQEAVDAPRVAQTSATGTPRREIGFDLDAIQGLSDLGHNPRSPSVIGSVQAVIINEPGDRKMYGAADKRRIGGIVSLRLEEIDAQTP
jgi:gamma-glutamyltranspeptidase/glutathione hydrolase